MDFSDTSIVITGSGLGIGRRAALEFASRGGLVTVSDLESERAEAVASEITGAGGRALAVAADVTDYDQVKALIDGTTTEFGRVDVLINNAGTSKMAMFVQTVPADWRFEIDLCLYGVMNGCHAVLPQMMERGSGKILNICSDAGRVGEPGLAAYSAAKAGVVGFTKAIAKEVARNNVLVNCLCFSAIRTEGIQAVFDAMPGMEEKMVKRYPMKRIGEPEEAVNAMMMMVSDYVTFTTGQVLSANGGYAMVG
ncbi:MAG: SDR family oxidoreductase [Actinobacteria bacterium]|nr:SDR family oxidoreductase [Actinomycetota bacterium]MBU1943483.1 SDR family oxidoreductase [Actinomycetota bacterium]MBU2686840.1 SDR family oxidoreductase [Actinomycetota bacterium]